MRVRIAHLSDPHFGGENRAAADAAVRALAQRPPDLTVVTGDLTLNGKAHEFRAAAAWLAELPSPKVVTPGNHDTPYLNLVLRALRPFDRYRRYIGDPEEARACLPKARAVAINTARGAQPRPDWSKGAINLDLCEAAALELAEGGLGALRVVACHHPLVEALDAPVTGGVHRGEAAAALLSERGVDLILTGHVHNPFAAPLPYGDGATYAVGAGTLSQRLRGSPAGYNLIEADEAQMTVTALGWSEGAFGSWRVWGLPRRRR